MLRGYILPIELIVVYFSDKYFLRRRGGGRERISIEIQ
jgi:hypothetical protein